MSEADDELLFDLVRNNVEGDGMIVGTGIAFEEWVHPKYRIFCAYAYRKDKV